MDAVLYRMHQQATDQNAAYRAHARAEQSPREDLSARFWRQRSEHWESSYNELQWLVLILAVFAFLAGGAAGWVVASGVQL